ncbi:cysteine desulfurase, partial [bacterium]|nr:cysteine desulfurase [bacterium]
GVEPGGVTFCSSGTEALNLAASGLVRHARKGGLERPHVLASAVEHKALLEPLEALARAGEAEVELVPVDSAGIVHEDELARRVKPGRTALACVIAAQNETGVLQPIDSLRLVAHTSGVPLLVDAAQAVGRVARDWKRAGWDYLVLSAHKLRAPRGAAALVRRKNAPSPEPMLQGGGQELGRRAGTEDVAAIVGLGEACSLLATSDLASASKALASRRDRLEDTLLREIPGSRVAAREAPRLSQTVSLLVSGARSEDLLAALDLAGIHASAGSACSSGALEPSHVLAAMRVEDDLARGVVRLSFGETTTDEELDRAATELARIATRGRDGAPKPR